MSEALIVVLVILALAAPIAIIIRRKKINKQNPDAKFVDPSKKREWKVGTVKQKPLNDGTGFSHAPVDADSDDGEEDY